MRISLNGNKNCLFKMNMTGKNVGNLIDSSIAKKSISHFILFYKRDLILKQVKKYTNM